MGTGAEKPNPKTYFFFFLSGDFARAVAAIDLAYFEVLGAFAT